MGEFVCPVDGCEKELNRLQVMHFRYNHGEDPVSWVRSEYGDELEEKYATGSGCYAIAERYEWLTPDMVHTTVDTRTHDEAMQGDNNPMNREDVVAEFTGDSNPAKQPSVREKISSALTGHTHSEETRQKISKANSGNEIGEEHRRAIAEASRNMDRSYMQTEAFRQTLSESLQGREPTYPKPYEVDELPHSVRSSWEEEIAISLIQNDVEYEYEPEFVLEERSYYPDFVTGEFVIEVKGFSNKRSITKANAFMDEYSSYTYVVVGDEIPCDVHVPWDDRERVLDVIRDD